MLHPPRLSEFQRYPVVAGTMALAIIVTVSWWAKADISPLFENAEIRRGELWRLVTSILPHVDLLHLAFNLYWFWVFGALVEEVYGHARTAGILLLLAIGSNALDFAFALGGVGLSGVGYGLFGLLWILERRDRRFRGSVDTNTIVLFIAWFFFCIVTTVVGVMPVANVAHAAGAVFGVLLGCTLTLPELRVPLAASTAALFLFALWGATFGRPYLNLSGKAGFEEGQWGFEALIANRNREAAGWLRDATAYHPNVAIYWYDLGIAYHRLGDKSAANDAYQHAQQLDPGNSMYSVVVGDPDPNFGHAAQPAARKRRNSR